MLILTRSLRRGTRTRHKANIKSFAELARKAGIHRNSLAGDLNVFNPVYLSVCKALGIEPAAVFETDSSTIKAAVNRIAPHRGFFLYGSRAKGTARKFSDYDIGVTGGENKIEWREFLSIKESLEEACQDLPVKVSLLNFDDAPDSFILDFDSPIEFFGGDYEAFVYFKGHLNGRKKVA